MEQKRKTKILVYDNGCPKCRFICAVVKMFDLRQKFDYYGLRENRGKKLLKEFFRIIPYNFHFVVDDKDLCYSGIKAIPIILYELILGLLWPYGSNGPHWIHRTHAATKV